MILLYGNLTIVKKKIKNILFMKSTILLSFAYNLCSMSFAGVLSLHGLHVYNLSAKIFLVCSYMMGMVTSSYDIAAMILTPLISYIGGSRKKPVFCAWGVFTMGVGFFIFILPHFVSPPYKTGTCTWIRISHKNKIK